MQLCAHTTVLPELEDARAARALLEHPRVGRMTSDGHVYRYLDPVTHKLLTLRGITKRLRELYWPDLSPFGSAPAAKKQQRQQARVRSAAPPPPRLEDAPLAAVRAAQQAVVTAARGSVRGSMVHQHVCDLVTLDAASFARKYPVGPHPWAPRVLKALLQRGWLPLCGNYPVCAEAAGYGTEIDQLWVTRAGAPVFVELKTSASRQAFVGSADARPMAGSMASLRQTPLHCALVQLLAGVLMAVRGVGLRGPFEAWVVHVDADAVDLYRLEDEVMLARGPALWADLHAG